MSADNCAVCCRDSHKAHTNNKSFHDDIQYIHTGDVFDDEDDFYDADEGVKISRLL